MGKQHVPTALRDVARSEALRAVDQALHREAHVLVGRPELTWQQLHNRLQWAGPPLADRLTVERERRSQPGGRPWLHRYTPLAESEALRRTLSGHTDGVAGVAISSDGTWLATAGRDYTVKLWDAATGAERATFTGHADRVTGVAISPDGTWLASSSADRTARIWDAATGATRATLAGHTGQVLGVALSPDGTWLATAGDDAVVRIWDAATGVQRATLAGHTDGVPGVAISPDGTWLATAGWDGTARIWDAATGVQRGILTGHDGNVYKVAISPDGTWLATGGRDMTAKLWDTATGRERATLTGHIGDALGLGSVWGLAISPDGTWLATTGMDSTVRIWDAATGRERATLAGHSDGVTGVAISPDGTWLATTSHDHTCKLWEAPSGAEQAARTGHTGQVIDLAISPDGTWLATAGEDQTARIWDMATGAERAVLTGHTGGVHGVRISPDGTWLATASWDQTGRVWDAASRTTRATLTGHTAGVVGLAISPDGTWLATAGWDHTARIWDAATGNERAALTGHTNSLDGVAISPDGTWLATASDDHMARIWDAATGTERALLTGHTGQLRSVAISPDGTWLATAGMDMDPVIPSGGIDGLIDAIAHAGHQPGPSGPGIGSTVRTWDAATGADRANLTGHRGRVHGVAISPDGAWLATIGWDNTARVWDAATGTQRAVLTGHTGTPMAVAISPDGRWLATGSWDNTARIWDVATGTELATLVVGGKVSVTAFHPFAPVLVCGDDGGGLHLATIVGVTLGPLVVTATDDRGTLTVRCPACCQPFVVDADRLGGQVTCPQPACTTGLQVNPFLTLARGTRLAQGTRVEPAWSPEYLNAPLERPPIWPTPPSFEPADPAPYADLQDLAIPAPAVGVAPSLAELVAQSGLSHVDLGGGSLAMSFLGSRAERLVVHAKPLASGLAFFAVALPAPGMFGGEAALRSLLGVSFRADYVKALVFPDGELAFACEQDLAGLSPARARGLASGLAALGDVTRSDLADAAGWTRRLLACRIAQVADIALDPVAARAAIVRLAAEGGLPVREAEAGSLVVELSLFGAGAGLRLVARVSDQLVSLIAFLGDAKPKGNKSAYMRRMLELNRSADVARLALDPDGDVALLYEVAEVGPDLFGRVRDQFGPLLAGLVALEQGG